MSIYYIAAPHFGHGNIIKHDGRPFETVAEMDETLIRNWNARVTNQDEVYILGDLCWGKEKDWLELLPKLNGRKHLIRGNHDIRQYSQQVRDMFKSPITDYAEIVDAGRRVILCHYPLLSYRRDGDINTYMLYGHVHTTDEYTGIRKAIDGMRESVTHYNYRGQLYNVFCGFYNWTPATLDEIIAAGK